MADSSLASAEAILRRADLMGPAAATHFLFEQYLASRDGSREAFVLALIGRVTTAQVQSRLAAPSPQVVREPA